MENMMQDIFTPEMMDMITKLGAALLLGAVLGIERIHAHKTAGMRTYALVSMGSALFVMVSEMARMMPGVLSADPLRMATQIVVGVGFLGAGLIIARENRVTGLTTASGLWVSAGIGAASGFGFFTLASIATVFTLFIFTLLWSIERTIVEVTEKNNHPPEN